MVDYLVEQNNHEFVIKGIRIFSREAEVTVSPYQYPEFTKPFERYAVPFVLENDKEGWIASHRFVESCKPTDPLVAVVQGMTDNLKEDSRVILTIASIGEIDQATRKQGQDALKKAISTG